MFGLTFEKLLIIGVIAAFIIGPDKLPLAAQKLRDLIHWARGAAGGAKERLREEMGDDFDDVDWRKLDPRQYDPRRIIRDALREELPQGASAGASVGDVASTPGTGAATGLAVAGAAAATVAGVGASSKPAWAGEQTHAAEPLDASDEIPVDLEAT